MAFRRYFLFKLIVIRVEISTCLCSVHSACITLQQPMALLGVVRCESKLYAKQTI